MKILTIVGARPQFIKAAMVSRIIAKHHDVVEILVHTGQHYANTLSTIFFKELELPAPKYFLGVGSGTHGVQTGKMLEALDPILLKEKPDVVLVYGDTNSTLAGALSASKLHIPVAHVEAGLRSFNRMMPEEINRILVDHISDYLFAPSETSVKNLMREGIPAQNIHLVGDVMYDAVLHYAQKAQSENNILEELNLRPHTYVLATIHRAENTDSPEILCNIWKSLVALSHEIPIVFPMHPRTRNALGAAGCAGGVLPETFKLIEPVSYLAMLSLEANSKVVITDSGGVQKEAFFLKRPCITLREETEWVELVDLGWNELVSPKLSYTRLLSNIKRLVFVPPVGANIEPYGKGDSAQKIVSILVSDQ